VAPLCFCSCILLEFSLVGAQCVCWLD
jgi:hypothetical protein